MTFTAASAGLFSIDDRYVGTFTVTVEPVFCTHIYVCLPSACIAGHNQRWIDTDGIDRYYRSILLVSF
jgi:hypothetical protein